MSTENTAPTPPAEPAPQAPPPAPPAEVATISSARLAALIQAESELAEVRRLADEKVEAERRRTIEAQAKAGDVEKAFEAERLKWQSDLNDSKAELVRAEQERLADRKDVTLAAILAGVEWANPDAARDAKTLLELRFDATRDPETRQVLVVEKGTRRPASEAVAEWLASPAAAHFLRPKTSGGSGASGGNVPPPSHPDAPKSTVDALLWAARQRQTSPGTNPYGPVYRPVGTN